MNIKVCGHQSLQDVETTLKTDIGYLGFIFAPSKRRVQAEQVREWIDSVDIKEKKLVGVFVNASFEEIADILKVVPLDVIQCHGTESPAYILTLKQMTNCEIWKAIHHEPSAVERMKTYENTVEGYVIDAKVSGQWGGTGQTFAWEYIPQYIEEAKRQGAECYIAGGVNVDTIDQLLTYSPSAIDIASGSETNGVKDLAKIKTIEDKVISYVTASSR
ncbi:phosphoribosylanthranilate isomerase [Bacillus solimangrovi]|uniref:N-(5'-phosphoribosyl)anthranilate isomerase n=1 Tax=Bacillus solimangrovi TaxID=1305675 RepID=A0A1E5LHC0_9BACI|nr:phosphoribosylanthranilate isomerase [Bacillus solimangrovi]OEH93446.1 N-(5'-phosphoribosyl)anthranilate isomerase [Bacillus solimangrovi]